MNKEKMDVLVMIVAVCVGIYFATFSNPLFCVVGLLATLTAWHYLPKMSSLVRGRVAS
ncbi:MAG: hypothetical protein OEW58_01460 [Gammaproteobacteria bacterium]|nr:hypothetical protein [Gammaproteobacteria bacterium]